MFIKPVNMESMKCYKEGEKKHGQRKHMEKMLTKQILIS